MFGHEVVCICLIILPSKSSLNDVAPDLGTCRGFCRSDPTGCILVGDVLSEVRFGCCFTCCCDSFVLSSGSSQVESLFQDLGSDLGVHGYRLSSLASKSVVDFDSPGKREIVSLGESETRSGFLDEEVVLNRRLIQNCCPYLEDVLTLIRSLGRAWKVGMVAGGSGTPFRAGQSPRLIGASGISPRSRRVIKPHPLKPMRVLPSLPEQDQRGERSAEKPGTGRGSAQTENTRLRLVEAFFHHLPGELQGIANFVVRYAVQNACEEVLSEVIRPAIATAVSSLPLAFNNMHRRDQARPAPSSVGNSSSTVLAGPDRGGTTRQSVDRLSASTTAALGENLESEARLIAGKRGKAIAVTTTMALVPHSLSIRYDFAGCHSTILPCVVDAPRDASGTWARQNIFTPHGGGSPHGKCFRALLDLRLSAYLLRSFSLSQNLYFCSRSRKA